MRQNGPNGNVRFIARHLFILRTCVRDSAGFGGGGDDCCDDESELPADGDGGWVKDVGSYAHGGAG